MKSKIEHLLYGDSSRLPLLALVPSRFEDEAPLSLYERLRALLPTLELRVTQLQKRQVELSERDEAEEEKGGLVDLNALRSEISMLEGAISWVEQQEERR